jgi:hypothetical protein
MSKTEDWFLDRIVFPSVNRVSGRTVAAIALVLYPGLGLVAPLLLGWPGNWFFTVNLIAVSFAAFISLAWLIVRLEQSHRRHLVDWTTNLRLLSAEEFEWFVGEIFRREGWTVRETGSQSRSDGNIDLEIEKPGDHRYVQCKRWEARQVPVDHVRSFAGALLREGTDGGHGIYVTLSGFNEHATREAQASGMTLIGGLELFRRAEAVRRTEPCPACGQPMTLGKSEHGWWFRCVAPGCAGKRDLGRDPAIAVELLTQPMPPLESARSTI